MALHDSKVTQQPSPSLKDFNCEQKQLTAVNALFSTSLDAASQEAMYKKISEDVASEFYKSTVTERRMNCIFETYSSIKKAIFGSPMLM